MDKRPIGVFDSGIGGLTVLREIMEQLPYENVIYFGDTARIPYGSKSEQTVKKFAYQCASFLKSKDVKTIVIACNTASAFAIDYLQERFDIPVIGVIEPGARGAVETTANGKIGVIGTSGTIGSGAYQAAIMEKNHEAEVIGIPSGSIGEKLYKAKMYLATPDLFAWTLAIVLMSILCERAFMVLTDAAIRRLEGV